jgi:hypothetical protein
MIKITDSQLQDFLRCGTLYDMRYRLLLPVDEAMKVRTAVEMTAKYYFMQRFDGKNPGTADMKRHWDSLCTKYSFEPKQVMEGLGQIMQFMQWVGRESFTVLDVDSHYDIVYGEVEVAGNMGILLQKYGKTSLLVLDFGSKFPNQQIMDQRLDFTLQAAAYERLYGAPLSAIQVRHFKQAKDLFTKRTGDDFIRLRAAVVGAGACIKQGLLFPRESALCESCQGLIYCKGWRLG